MHTVIGQLLCLYQAMQTWLWHHSMFPNTILERVLVEFETAYVNPRLQFGLT